MTIRPLSAAIAASALALSFPASAEDTDAPLTVQQAVPLTQSGIYLPANTEVRLRLNQEVTTKGKSWSEGDNFDLTVADDVRVRNMIVIPRGTRAVGHISWMTNKGMFGKSGKLEVELDYVMLGERRIPLNGTFRQEGEGNTVATIAGVVAVGPFGAVITGKSGTLPAGMELKAYTQADLALALAEPETQPLVRAAIIQ